MAGDSDSAGASDRRRGGHSYRPGGSMGGPPGGYRCATDSRSSAPACFAKGRTVCMLIGHDAHTAMLLGAIALLYAHRATWRGGIRCLFQPGEEKAPGGASLLIQERVLDEVPIRAIFGQHVTPSLPVGTIGLRAGPFMAASDELHITLVGRGGHAAHPHLVRDPIWVAAQLITSPPRRGKPPK